MRILSIDPAYSEKGSKTGFAVYMDQKIVEYGVLTKKQVDDPYQIDYFLGLCDELVVEDQYCGPNVETLKKLIYARDLWIIPARRFRNIRNITLYKPQKWMKALSRARRGFQKRDPDGWASYIKLRWGLNGAMQPDSVAAMCILSVYLDERNLIQP